MERSRKNILLIISICVVLHGAISFISALKIGEATTNLLAIRGNIPEEVTQNPEMAKQWIENETRDAAGFWYPIFHLFNHYPVGWIVAPTTTKIGRYISNRYLKRQNIVFSQVKVQLWSVALSKTLINSFSFGLCLMGGWVLIRKTSIRT